MKLQFDCLNVGLEHHALRNHWQRKGCNFSATNKK